MQSHVVSQLASSPKLLKRVSHKMNVLHLAKTTEKAFFHWILEFILHAP